MKQRQTLSDLLRETHIAPALLDRLPRKMFNMGARYPTAFSTTLLAAPPASGAETIAGTTPPLTLPFDGAIVFVFWFAILTVGTGTTIGQAQIRRGLLLTSPVLLPVVGQATTAVATAFSGCAVDVFAGAGQPQYSLTFNGAGTTGAWTLSLMQLLAFAL